MLDLVHQPVWIGGVCAAIVGFLLQAVALGTGRISLVFRVRLHRREWSSAAAMALGLALFLYSAASSGGDPTKVAPLSWVLGIVVTLAVAAVFVWLGLRRRYGQRAAYLAVATGTMFGLTAALINGMTAAFAHGIVGVLTAWQTYAVLVLGPISVFLLQNTLQAGQPVRGPTRPHPDRPNRGGGVGCGHLLRTGSWRSLARRHAPRRGTDRGGYVPALPFTAGARPSGAARRARAGVR
ncbi:MAG: hypothetical protein GEV03_14435 [Streptosporangiales bacterium]|nr:hypothetical protein [Streptosporangiales bacterium]